MPKELTHWILADQALARLKNGSRLRELLLTHHDCYLGGAVLPDTLLHLVRGPRTTTALSLARTFHDNDGDSFLPLVRAERSFTDGLPPAVLACLLGVITHMQTDIVFHPFVYALTGTHEIGSHYRLETDIDVHFLQNGAAPAVRHLSDLVTSASRPVLIDTCALLFDPERRMPRPALEQALNMHCRFQGMYDKTFWKLAVKLAVLLGGARFREQRHLFYPLTGRHECRFADEPVEWRHPVSAEFQRTSLEQLADQAVQRSATLFETIEGSESLSEALAVKPGENLLTGMHGACLSSMGTSTSK